MTEHAARRVWLALGSNLGEREAYLAAALARIGALPGTRLLRASSVIETPPWGITEQPAFLNMAACIETSLPPETLLDALLHIETALGRERQVRWGPRTIDIDMLVYEGETRDTPRLRLPHPGLTARRFVLEPLAEIAPNLVVNGKTVAAWRAELET